MNNSKQNKNTIPIEKLVENINESFIFLEKLQVCPVQKKLILWEMGTVGKIYDKNSNVVGETKILVEDFLDYINTPHSHEIKRAIDRFFKISQVETKDQNKTAGSTSSHFQGS